MAFNKRSTGLMATKMGWLLGAEMIAKSTRVLTVLALAYWLAPDVFGDVVLVTVLLEVARTLAQSGLGTRFIGAPADQLAQMAGVVRALSGVFAVVAGSLLVLLAALISVFTDRDLFLLALCTAPTLLLYPLVTTRALVAQRNYDARRLSCANALSLSLDNLSLAAFLLAGLGVWSLPAAKFVAALTWVFYWRTQPCPAAVCAPGGVILHSVRFALRVAAGDLLRLSRMHLDLLPALVLFDSLEFGLYTFAKNAGVGLGQSLTQAFNTLLLPQLAAQFRDMADVDRLRSSTLAMSAGIAGVFVLQAVAAFVYVPLLFGDKWTAATPVVAVLCLSAIPRLYLDVSSVWLRAARRTKLDLLFNLILGMAYAVLLLLTVTLLVPSTPAELAVVVTFNLTLAATLPALLNFHLPETQNV